MPFIVLFDFVQSQSRFRLHDPLRADSARNPIHSMLLQRIGTVRTLALTRSLCATRDTTSPRQIMPITAISIVRPACAAARVRRRPPARGPRQESSPPRVHTPSAPRPTGYSIHTGHGTCHWGWRARSPRHQQTAT